MPLHQDPGHYEQKPSSAPPGLGKSTPGSGTQQAVWWAPGVPGVGSRPMRNGGPQGVEDRAAVGMGTPVRVMFTVTLRASFHTSRTKGPLGVFQSIVGPFKHRCETDVTPLSLTHDTCSRGGLPSSQRQPVKPEKLQQCASSFKYTVMSGSFPVWKTSAVSEN